MRRIEQEADPRRPHRREGEAGHGRGDHAAAQQCSICQDDALTCPVDTNCGHTFCAPCILRWCRNHHATCPICRRQVTLLMGASDWQGRNNEQTYREVAEYNHRHQGQAGYLGRLFDIPALFRHLWTDYFRIGGIPVSTKCYFLFIALLALFYLISPLDLFPELIFGIVGVIDDVIAIAMMVVYVAEQYRAFVVNVGDR